jgi:hypothetical protein
VCASADHIDKETLEIRPEDDEVYKSMQTLAEELPGHSPRFVLLSYPLTLVGPHLLFSGPVHMRWPFAGHRHEVYLRLIVGTGDGLGIGKGVGALCSRLFPTVDDKCGSADEVCRRG